MVVVGKTKLTALITIPVKEEKENNYGVSFVPRKYRFVTWFFVLNVRNCESHRDGQAMRWQLTASPNVRYTFIHIGCVYVLCVCLCLSRREKQSSLGSVKRPAGHTRRQAHTSDVRSAPIRGPVSLFFLPMSSRIISNHSTHTTCAFPCSGRYWCAGAHVDPVGQEALYRFSNVQHQGFGHFLHVILFNCVCTRVTEEETRAA